MPIEQTASQALAEKLRALAKRLAGDDKLLTEATGPIVESMVDLVEHILDGQELCLVLLAMGEDFLREDWLKHPDVPSALLFELTGRMQALTTRLGMVATHEEQHEDPSEHVGHNCALDPTRSENKAN
jgi:hypothetical protein